MEAFWDKLAAGATDIAGKILFAVVLLIVGRLAIRYLMRLLERGKLLARVEETVKRFALSFVKAALYLILIISVVGVLGVPLASIVAVLASAGAAVGLALQGALSNLAGGIMLMVFKPFKAGDYVEAAGAAGIVREVTLFYTVLVSVDNKRITVPNGTLMNSNVVDYSAEELRRVDLSFSCAKTESPASVQEILLRIASAHALVLKEPAEPFARILRNTNDAMEFAVRVWCRNEDYWTVYHDLTQQITEALAENGVQTPAMRVLSEQK